MKYQALLFDLDGTLTASGEGITKSVQYALNKLGREELGRDLKALEVFVGPPLNRQFQSFCGCSQEEADRAVVYYRERYNTIGIYENKPYPGVKKLLEDLRKKGYLLAVASSKPDPMVHIVLEHFSLSGYFHKIQGSDLNRPHMTKAEVIEQVLKEMELLDKRDRAVMIGDRRHDVLGAREMGLSCIGVTYGYGSREELEEAGAMAFAKDVPALGALLGV